jgi:P4 family phage/plasmid primase-like protien
VRRVRTDVTARLVPKPGGGKSAVWDKHTGLTPEVLAKHLNGGPARGVALMQPGADVTLAACLDLDSHSGEVGWGEMATIAGGLADALALAWGASPVCFRSSGGRGVHLWLLWDDPQPAWAVREWLAEVLVSVGLRAGVGSLAGGQVEVFPKQDMVREGGFGNQVFLPLAGHSEPLAFEDLSGMLVPCGLDGLVWGVSPPLAARERVARREVGGVDGVGLDDAPLRGALDAIGEAVRAGRVEGWGRNRWRDVLFGLHEGTGGAEEGRVLAHEWSTTVPDYDAAEVDKVWDSAEAGRDGAIGLGSLRWLARSVGWLDPAEIPNADDFSVVEEVSSYSLMAGGAGGAEDDLHGVATVERGAIPKAHHLCTDQANANRLVAAYGNRVLVAAGRWHVWDGVRWKPDDADIYRFACKLSLIVKEEARTVRTKARAASLGAAGGGAGLGDGSVGRVEKAEKIAEALESWSVRCESKGNIEAAIGLARKMLTVDASLLDRDGMLLNVLNGVVDLRDGTLREHRADDLITKLAPVEYREGAVCEVWERTVREIVRGDDAVAGFLQRWFGYCATGSVQEQVFVVHWGDGSNGKSTVLDTVASALGDYAGVAAPGLVAASDKSERHPTEIAALMGKRMVTASETREGVQLREDFVKQATGDKKLTARFMREDFFDFNVTHKIQLLTNSKPTVRGQDHGIWRRVRLVAYAERFGSEGEVKAGLAGRVKDLGLLRTLESPDSLRGVLAWLVRGAVDWWNGGGLREPSAVVEASESYRHEQDRVRQFVGECCEVGVGFSEPLTAGMTGLYPGYAEWCREGGYSPLARGRMLHELERVVPGCRTESAKMAGESGKGRRSVVIVRGLRILQE